MKSFGPRIQASNSNGRVFGLGPGISESQASNSNGRAFGLGPDISTNSWRCRVQDQTLYHWSYWPAILRCRVQDQTLYHWSYWPVFWVRTISFNLGLLVNRVLAVMAAVLQERQLVL